jgi:hypothetical protein
MADETIIIKVETDGVDNLENELNGATEASKSLKQELKEARNNLLELSQTPGVDPKAVEEAAQKVGELKDAIADANEQANIFASGSKYERVGNAFGEIKGAIANLDFEKAQARAQAFAKVAGDINFKDAINSVKQLGSTFISIGKALLTNPLFLLAAVIVGIVVAIVALMKEIGLLKVITDALKKAFDFLMIPINALIQGLKDLTDWFGWTSNAAEESAQKQADAAAKAADAQKKSSESTIQSLNNQIRMRELEGKSTTDLERQKVQELRKTAAEQAKADRLAYQSAVTKGELSKEEIANLKEVARQSRLAYQQAESDVKFFEASVRKELKETREEATKKDKEEEEKRKADRNKAYKDRLQKEREFRDQRLAIERQIEDIRFSLMEEGLNKDLKGVDVKYKRMREDILSNEKLTADERETLLLLADKQLSIEREKIFKADTDKFLAEEKKKNEDRIKLEDAQFQLQTDTERAREELKISQMVDGLEKEKALIQFNRDNEILAIAADYDKKLELAAGNDELEKLLIEQQNAEIKAINDKAREDELAAEEAAQKKKIQGIIQTGNLSLDATRGGLQGIADLVNAFAGKSEGAQRKAFETTKKLNIAMATIDMIKGAVSAFTGMVSQIPGPVGIALGAVAAAGVVASGIANIKKISDTKFEGGGTPTPDAPSGNLPSSVDAAPTPPGLSLFGQPLSSSEGGNQQNEGLRQQSMVKAVVVESDISDVQNRMATYQNRAEIG